MCKPPRKKVAGLPQDEVAGVAEHERWLPRASDRSARCNSGLSPRLIHWSLVSRQQLCLCKCQRTKITREDREECSSQKGHIDDFIQSYHSYQSYPFHPVIHPCIHSSMHPSIHPSLVQSLLCKSQRSLIAFTMRRRLASA